MANLKRLHKLVWDFRQEADSWWATPSPELARLYAFSEMGEAVDAWIRLNVPGQSRNNQKEADVLGELADTAIMLLSINPEMDFQFGTTDTPYYSAIDGVAHYVSRATIGPERSRDGIERALLAIAAYPGMVLDREIHKRLDRIRQRHQPQ